MAARYYLPDDSESYVTPSRLRRLGRRRQVEHMVHWFRERYCDPAEETPYESKEGGYQYIWGGPYDATDELGSEFAGVASDEAIEEAVKEVEADGLFDWAPTSSHPNRSRYEDEAMAWQDAGPMPPTLDNIQARLEGGIVPSFGGYEREQREVVLRELAELRSLLERELPRHGGIGHNQPPEHLSLAVELNVEVLAAADRMKAELEQDAPNVEAVANATGTLQGILSWMSRKLDKAADSFATSVGKADGVAVAGAIGVQIASAPVGEMISRVITASLEWLDRVTLPF